MPFLKGEDILIVMAIVVTLFGGTLLPRLARSWGKGIKELRAIHADSVDAVTDPAEANPRQSGTRFRD